MVEGKKKFTVNIYFITATSIMYLSNLLMDQLTFNMVNTNNNDYKWFSLSLHYYIFAL